jgi:hypothetical protein
MRVDRLLHDDHRPAGCAAAIQSYYNEGRVHISLGKDAPCGRQIERFGDMVAQYRAKVELSFKYEGGG